MDTADQKRTTVGLSKSLKSRIDSLKPYDSMSYEEFLSEMANHYEEVAHD